MGLDNDFGNQETAIRKGLSEETHMRADARMERGSQPGKSWDPRTACGRALRCDATRLGHFGTESRPVFRERSMRERRMGAGKGPVTQSQVVLGGQCVFFSRWEVLRGFQWGITRSDLHMEILQWLFRGEQTGRA